MAETGPRVGDAAWRGRTGSVLVKEGLLRWGGGGPARKTVPPHPPAGLATASANVQVLSGVRWEAQAGPHAEGVHCTPRAAATITPCVFGPPGSYAKGSEAARNSTFTRAAPVRTISSRRAAS